MFNLGPKTNLFRVAGLGNVAALYGLFIQWIIYQALKPDTIDLCMHSYTDFGGSFIGTEHCQSLYR